MKANIKNRWHSVIPASDAFFASLFAVASAQTTPTSPSVTPEPETIQLSPFEVTFSTDTGYSMQDTLAGNRLRTSVRDVGSALSIYNSKFLEDIGSGPAGRHVCAIPHRARNHLYAPTRFRSKRALPSLGL